ncbi:MAG: tripartite tricarboxylate transporter substrate binding protein [Ramlibacter sp.]|nr:tripartite tricarboxylate transporter substrate binding protein [Ramlibacter sp.]
MTSTPSRRTVVGGLLAMAAWRASAQGFPGAGPVGSLVIPLGPGTLADLHARKFAALLVEATGSPYVVENITGAGGLLAVRQVLRRPADGRTVLWSPSSLINTPLLSKTAPEYDPVADFIPVCIFVRSPFVLFAGKDFPANNIDELQKLGKAQAEPLTYVAIDAGSANHLAAEVLLQRLGVRSGTLIPYRNNQQAIIDVSEGRVQLGVLGLYNVAAMLKTGKVKVLAVLADRPLSAAPALPTLLAQGFGGFEMQGWFGLFLARGTPLSIVLDYEKQMQLALKNKGFVDLLVETGQEPVFYGHQEARAFVISETERYRGVLQRLKLI